jgi:tRNA modification GTPase
VAVIRVSGGDSWAIGEAISGKVLRERYAAFAQLRRNGELLDTGVVIAFKAPRSYTGEDVVEFQVHGGEITPRRVLDACIESGARLARRGEFTERAYLNGKLDYDQAEAVIDLINSKTLRSASNALESLSGSKDKVYRVLYDQAIDISSRIEHSLDVDEGELPNGFIEKVLGDIAKLNDDIGASIRSAKEGKILRNGAIVVIAGAPNSGKSSLMNALLGENRAIVSNIAGTTRDSIEEWIDIEGWPVKLVDTAGLRSSEDVIEVEGVRRSYDLIRKADVVLMMNPSESDVSDFAALAIPVHSKCDLSRSEEFLNVSSVTGEGLTELKREIAAKLSMLACRPLEDADVGADEVKLAILKEAQAMLSGYDAAEDLVLLGGLMRRVSEKLGELIGSSYSSDLLERLFSRFCVGK